ncbi:CerR family C-terminal domain-containing protein [Consotaella aegiceratis]|uniref:CerR family C-terminal domain-containing protein n=1 Tax=Consotaella aegiceratis TaxID=3097961 RepID=UPI002F41E54A
MDANDENTDGRARAGGRARGAQARSDATRDRILAAALDVFGRMGFEGATTRSVANAAGVNLQAISYYFGGKEGLYTATAEYLAALIGVHITPRRIEIARRLAELDAAGEALSEAEARLILHSVLETVASIFLGREADVWARFLVREQMEPTEAFSKIYDGVMGPMLAAVGRLMATILHEDPTSDYIRLRTLSFVGNILIYRIGRATVLRQMSWDEIGEAEAAEVKRIVHGIIDDLVPVGEATR